MHSPTRRQALVVIAAAGTPALQAQEHHHSAVPAETQPYTFRTLTAAEQPAIAKLVDLIIPRTDTPGASDAGVVEFLDRRMFANPTLASSFRHGMSLLDAAAQRKFNATFGQLSQAQAIELLTPMSQQSATSPGRFFKLAKDLTIDGYYSSKAGLTEELGWHGNTFVAEFKGCTHPEHQA